MLISDYSVYSIACILILCRGIQTENILVVTGDGGGEWVMTPESILQEVLMHTCSHLNTNVFY